MNDRILIWMPQELAELLEAEARKKGVTAEELAGNVLEEHFAAQLPVGSFGGRKP